MWEGSQPVSEHTSFDSLCLQELMGLQTLGILYIGIHAHKTTIRYSVVQRLFLLSSIIVCKIKGGKSCYANNINVYFGRAPQLKNVIALCACILHPEHKWEVFSFMDIWDSST